MAITAVDVAPRRPVKPVVVSFDSRSFRMESYSLALTSGPTRVRSL